TLVPFQTEPNTMGLYCVYPTHPTLAPEGLLTLERVTDAPTLDSDQAPIHGGHPGLSTPEISAKHLFDGFSNHTSGVLIVWHYSGTNSNSAVNVNCLAEFL
ncbi:uncharacterized protein EDB93DRAFT_1059958, partial [Suillus bovinus]|uniref:uncharacterized protein n=1 Tax=Suillus bovinus TaxID=48563 RepID=UPI001B8620AE